MRIIFNFRLLLLFQMKDIFSRNFQTEKGCVTIQLRIRLSGKTSGVQRFDFDWNIVSMKKCLEACYGHQTQDLKLAELGVFEPTLTQTVHFISFANPVML